MGARPCRLVGEDPVISNRHYEARGSATMVLRLPTACARTASTSSTSSRRPAVCRSGFPTRIGGICSVGPLRVDWRFRGDGGPDAGCRDRPQEPEQVRSAGNTRARLSDHLLSRRNGLGLEQMPSPQNARILIAPATGPWPIPESEWVPITDAKPWRAVMPGRPTATCFTSLPSKTLTAASGRSGWTRARASRRGAPFAARPFAFVAALTAECRADAAVGGGRAGQDRVCAGRGDGQHLDGEAAASG